MTADLRFQRLVIKVHALGPRVLAELLDELGRERLLRFPIEQKLRRFAALDRETVRALGADRFAANPLRIVSTGRDSR